MIKMAAKNSSYKSVGGVLTLLGSLVYLYVLYMWYSGGASTSGWLGAASFLTPFVIGAAVVAGISLLFMSFGIMAGKGAKSEVLWKFISLAGVVYIILGGSSWFYVVLLGGFVLTSIGAMVSAM